MQSKSVTLDAIAKEAGVSAVTVSNILRGKNKEKWPSSLARAERVRAIAAKLGYRTNSGAKAIATGRFHAVALMLSDVPHVSTVPMRMLKGIQTGTKSHDLHMIIGSLPAEFDSQDDIIPKILRESMVDGLLIDYTHAIPPSLMRIISSHQIPAIWVNVKQKADCVYPDDYKAGVRIAEHLTSLGHKQIGYISYVTGPPTPEQHYSVFDRRRGLEEVLGRTGGMLNDLSRPESQFLENLAFWRSWFRANPKKRRPTAFVGYSQDQIIPLLRAAELERLSIPSDFSVATFDDAQVSYFGLPICMCRIRWGAVGEQAVHQLTAKIERPSRPTPAVAVPAEWIVGESAVPLRSSS